MNKKAGNIESNRIIHVSRMQQEILLQLMIKDKAFKDIAIGELEKFARLAIPQIRNYQFRFKNGDREIRDDNYFNNPLMITNLLLDK